MYMHKNEAASGGGWVEIWSLRGLLQLMGPLCACLLPAPEPRDLEVAVVVQRRGCGEGVRGCVCVEWICFSYGWRVGNSLWGWECAT